MIGNIIAILGILCLLYFIVCVCCTGFSGTFSYVWLAFSVVCLGVYVGIGYMQKHAVHPPIWLKGLLAVIIVAAAGTFLYVEGLIASYSDDMPKDEVEYVIVLGAKIDGTRITRSLRMRLDAALEYAQAHESTKIIVSGGQGDDEQVSEAEAMYGYLVEKGIDPSRIIKEDMSTNTDENIAFSRKIMDDDNASVAIVTNSFHLYRAICIANKQGLTNVSGIAAETDKFLAINYYFREGLAVIKYKLSGQI